MAFHGAPLARVGRRALAGALGVVALTLLLGAGLPRNLAAIAYLRDATADPSRARWDQDCLTAMAQVGAPPVSAIDAPTTLARPRAAPDPRTPWGQCLLGAEAWLHGDAATAIAQWATLPALGLTLAARARREPAAADSPALTEAALRIAPDDARVWRDACLGPITDERRLAVCRGAVDRDPSFRQGWEALALAVSRRGDLQQAERILDEGRVADGAIAWTLRADAALARGDAVRAIAEYQRALPAWPQNPYIPFNLGRAHLLVGDRVAARAAFARALQIDPTFAEARRALDELAP